MLSRSGAASAPLLRNPYVCTRCLRRAATRKSPAASTASSSTGTHTNTSTTRRLRFYSTTTAPSSSTSGITPLPHRRLLALSGPDAPKFLQGLTTNNVAPTPNTTGWYTAFLNAQGRVLHDAFIYPTNAADGEWACLIEVDAASLDGLATVLKRHKLRSKVKIERVSQEEGQGAWGVWAAWGQALPVVAEEGSRSSSAIVLEDPRAPGLGWRVLVQGGGHDRLPVAGLPRREPRDYQVRRYLHGVAEGPAEMRAGEALPLESNVDVMRGVDFRKGCYVGQELTIRTKHTGVVRKRILPVRLYGLGGEEPGELEFVDGGVGEEGVRAEEIPGGAADVRRVAGGEGEEQQQGAGRKRSAGRSAGKWLAGVGNVGLALCRLEMMTDVKVVAEGMGTGGYQPGMRFGLKWSVEGEKGERSVGVKAFVPEWHQMRAEEEARGKKKKQQQVVDES